MRLLTLFGALALMATPAAAQEDKQGLKAIGLGVVAQTQPYAEIDDSTRVNIIPALSYDRGRFWIQGKQLGLILTDPQGDGPWEFSAILDYRFDGYDDKDSPVLLGMMDRQGTLEAGGVLTYDMGDARLLGQVRTDVLDEHGGFDLVGQAEYTWQPATYTQIRPYAGLQFRSEDQADYYFGVLPSEERIVTTPVVDAPTTRLAYAPGETLSPFVGVTVRQALSRHFALQIFAQHEFLADEISDSPIVSEESQTRFGVFLVKPLVGK